MRTELETTLPDTCIIERRALVADSIGGRTESWAAAGTVACRLSPSGGPSATGGSEQERAGQIAAIADWTVTLPAGTDVTEVDRLSIGSVTYEVSAIRSTRSDEISTRVEAVKII